MDSVSKLFVLYEEDLKTHCCDLWGCHLPLLFVGIDVIWPTLIHKINLFIDCIPIITFQLFVNVYKNSNSELKLFFIGPQQVFSFPFLFSNSLELISILKVERHFNSQIAMVNKSFSLISNSYSGFSKIMNIFNDIYCPLCKRWEEQWTFYLIVFAISSCF